MDDTQQMQSLEEARPAVEKVISGSVAASGAGPGQLHQPATNPPTTVQQGVQLSDEMWAVAYMLGSDNACSRAIDELGLVQSDFIEGASKDIFQAIFKLYKAGTPITSVFVSEELGHKLDRVGGMSTLVSLATAGYGDYVEQYVDRLKRAARRRAALSAVGECRARLDSGDDSAIEPLIQKLSSLSRQSTKASGITLSELISGKDGGGQSLFALIQQRADNFMKEGQLQIPGISTGYLELDKLLGGLRRENLIIFGGRTGMGKSSGLLNILRNISIAPKEELPKRRTAIFSLEMSAHQLLYRLLASQSGVNSQKIETGELDTKDLEKIRAAMDELGLGLTKIYGEPRFKTLSAFLTQARKAVLEDGAEAIFLDYLQLMLPDVVSGIPAIDLMAVTRGLKGLACELQIPILAAAQLNREAADGSEPELKELKGSGSLEEDADSVIFLHRRDYYDPTDKPGIATLIVAKNRHGSVGRINYEFNADIGIFVEMEVWKPPADHVPPPDSGSPSSVTYKPRLPRSRSKASKETSS